MLKPNYKTRAFWAACGVASIVVGSLIFYLLAYKHGQATVFAFACLVVSGWFGIIYSIFPGCLDKNKKGTKVASLKILSCFLFAGAVGVSVNYVISLEKSREKYILTHSRSVITKAKITSIEMRRLKNGTRRYIHLEYIANGNTVQQEMPDDKAEFELIQTYKLKYSVKYPEMFEIYK